ncbi:MAG: hypothetical protein IJQ20_01875 [Paludibacteraceae bacterium]|nr:hypothetical protein [Paludibacteraceae bacterium]
MSFRLSASSNTDYVFKGWNKDATSNDVLSSNNPWDMSVDGDSKILGSVRSSCTYTYYAIFARLTANKSSLDFGEKNVDLGWGNAKSVKVTYVHTGKTTATISGTNGTNDIDFAFKVNNNYVQSTTVAENSTNSETTTEVTVYFNPQCDGEREATLTFSGNGLTKTVILTGTGVKNAQTLSWDNESSIEVNMKHESIQYISASSTSGLAVSYESSNTAVLQVFKDGEKTKLSTRGLGTATITVTQAGNCKYSEATPITKTFTVSSKATPIFTPNGFDDSETKQLKVGDKVTLEVEYVSNGLNGDFTATASKDNMLSFTRSGNIITIEALNAGDVTATFKQTENSGFYGVTKNYSFSISKYQPSFSGSPYNLMVEASQTADYDFENVSTTTLTGDSNDELYYTIDDVSLNEIHSGNNLITFDPSTKRITACNAGTCKITLHQKETYKYAGAEQSFNVTVHKYNSTFADVNDFGVKVEASQASSYTLTYTKPNDEYIGENILAGTPSANSSDNFYYTLTHNVTATNTDGSSDAKKAIAYVAGEKKATGKNAGTATVHLYQKETYKYNAADEDFVVTVTKNDPVFTWNNGSSTYYHNTSVANICSSTNTDFAFTIDASTDANVAKESGNTLSVLSKNGSANFTVSQVENYKWNSKSQTFTVTPQNPSNHVEFTYTQAMYNDNSITTQKVSSAWDGSNQVRLGETGSGFNWDDRYIVIHFLGIPDKLSFQYKASSGAATGADWYVQESANGSSWTDVWTTESRSTSWSSISKALKTTTRYLKFCYSGNFAGYFKDIKVTELKKFAANKSSLDFGENEVNDEVSPLTFGLNYANAGHAVTLTTNDSKFTVSPTTITSIGGEKTGTFTPITVSYSTAEEHTSDGAQLTIQDELGNKTTVNLSGKTAKHQPTVDWSSNAAYFNVDEELSATSANGLTVTLSSVGNESYVSCSGNTATMLEATEGTITITAHVTGDNIYADADFTKDITITNKEKQSITWTQDFSRLKTTDGTKSITLNATASSGLAVSYALVGDKTGLNLTQSGNVWTLTYSANECKNTTIVASQGGDGTYAPASSVSLPVKVIDPTKVCDASTVLVNSQVSLIAENILTPASVTYNIDIPASMTVSFSRVKDKNALGWDVTYLLGVDVVFYSGRNGTGDELYTKSYSADDINKTLSNSTINLNSYINAKSVKITTSATNGYYIDAVSYTHRKYCEISANSLNFSTYPNTQTVAQNFNVNYSHYPILLECSNPKFSFTPTEFGDCFEYGAQQVSVTYTAGAAEGNDVGYLYIKDNTGATLQTCTLNVTISKVAQTITMSNIQSSYMTTDKVTLTAESNSGLTDFTYSASPDDVASFNGAEMTFVKSGTIAVTVNQAGNDVYNSASATVQNVVVSKATPDIATAPTGTGLTYLQTLNQSALSGGAADITLRGVAHTKVPGTFAWTNPSQQITDNAGPHNYSVTFTPTDGGMYTTKVFDVSINVARADQSLEMRDGSVKVLIYGLNDNLAESKLDLSSLIVSKTDADHAGEVTYEVISANKANASINDNIFSATAGGEYTILATQRQTDYYNQATDEFVVTVSRVTSEISNTSVKTLKVDAIQENAFTLVNTQDLIPHITVKSMSEINNGDGQVIEYDAINNRIIAHNAGVAEIYLEQPETSTINASNSEVFTYTVEKLDNSFTSCSWGAWSKEANFNDNVPVEVTTQNVDYTHSPIIAEASAADSLLALMTKVDATHFNMTASVNVGISTWTLTQAEDYKYLAASHEIQLIIKSLTKECLIYDNPTEYHFETDANDFSGHFEEENTHQVSGPADKIYFEAKKSLIGVNKFIVQYSVDGSTWRTIVDEPNLSFDYKSFSYTFSELPGANALQENEKVAYIRFGAHTGATLSKYYKNVKISRKTWLKAVDASNAELDTLVMPENALGNSTTATFRVNYSTCDNVVKLESNNEHFALSTTNITVDGDNIGSPTEITITYSNSVVADDTATITVYTKYENTTFTVVGKTNKKEQFIEWQEGFTDRPLILSLGAGSTNEHPAAKATSNESVVYTTDDPEIIEITLGGLGFTVIGDGTAKLCASQAGNAIWNAVSDTITIATTGKRIQQIVWEQNFRTVDWVIGQDTTLTAKVYLRDAKGNLVFSQERTDSIIYSCPKNNGVISIDSTSMTILGYGKTTVMAYVPGDELYEDVMPVSLIVKVREPSEGCEAEPVLAINENIQLFSMEMNLSNGFSTPKLTSNVIELDASKGKPGFLSYQHNAEAYTISLLSFCGGTVVAQQRIHDSGEWINIAGSEYTTDAAYDWRDVDSLQLDERADAIQFVRLDGGTGYHNFQGIQITLKHYLRATQSVLDLGDINIGERIKRDVRFEYSDVKAELQVSKTDSEDDMLSIDDNDIDSISCGMHGLHDISIDLLPSKLGEWSDSVLIVDTISKDTAIVFIKATIVPGSQFVFEDAGPWVYDENWKGDMLPGTDDAVLISADADIRAGDTIYVKSMTISSGVSVTVHGVLTLLGDNTYSLPLTKYGNLHVADSGKVVLGNNVLLVNDFVLDAALGNKEKGGYSGQITNYENLFVRGNAYFDLALDPSGECSPGWYDFTVPFPVHALTGITRFDNSTHVEKSITNEVNYAIMDFSESRHLETGYGWKKYRDVMQPGQCYTITIDDVDNVYRFKKTKDGEFNTKSQETLVNTNPESKIGGWNGLGNGTLTYVNLSAAGIEEVQVYDHATNTFSPVDINEYTYVVGAAYLVQTPATGKELSYTLNEIHTLRAPQRTTVSPTSFKLSLTRENEEIASDRLYVGATNESLNSYEIGRDLSKFGDPLEAKEAQIWVNAYGMKLCDIDMPLNNNSAHCDLSVFAPQAGQYTLAVDRVQENTVLYLTYNDRPIWNLTMSPYMFDLEKGTTEGYGLQLYVRQSPEVATGVDGVLDAEVGVQKVLINDKMYLITPEGAMFDATGKKIQ